jgi:16S rRNA (uracil1498-N3)-methyltransferase
MPATPAWPPKSTPRVFVDEALAVGASLRLDGAAAHYLLSVMRLKQDGALKLFDDRSGEYRGIITSANKRDLTVHIDALLRPRDSVPDLWLCQALIKKDRFDWIAEKSCELGIARFVPVLTSRCVVDKVKDDRLRSHMIEAAEQCERTALPEIAPLDKLASLLKTWPTDRRLYYCNERGGAAFPAAMAGNSGPAAILIGPEGGFTDQEIAMLEHHDNTIAVSLGPRILRADTAAITAISIWMAHNGDW